MLLPTIRAGADGASDGASDGVDRGYRYDAVVMPRRQVTLKAEVGGRLEVEAMAEAGERVEAGQVLARLDDAEQRAVVAAARLEAEQAAAIERTRQVLEEMQIRLDQADDMFSRGAGSEYEVRQARVQHSLAEIDVALAEREQESAARRLAVEEARLSRYRFEAPFAGRVLRVVSRGGQTVEAGDEVLVLAALDELEAAMSLPVRWYDRVEAGGAYRLMAGPPVGRALVGQVRHIDPLIDAASGTFRVVFRIDNGDGGLPAGFVVWPAGDELVPVEAEGDAAVEAGDPEIESAEDPGAGLIPGAGAILREIPGGVGGG